MARAVWRPAPRDLSTVVPARLAAWDTKDDGRVVITRPRPETTGLRGLFDRLSHRMSMPKIRLDAVGSVVWRQLDGEHTVRQVCAAVRGELGEAVEPVEERVGTFLSHLHELELVALPGLVPAEPPAGDP
jgi:hypothetical protein